jgi:ketosteroid isomerase-like protein
VSIEAEILAISAAWDAALIANDADGVASFMADDWVFVGPTGVTRKNELIGWIASGRLLHDTMDVVGVPRVADHGDVIVVTARKASSGSWDGKQYTADEWTSEVFVRKDGRWRCVLSHKAAAD